MMKDLELLKKRLLEHDRNKTIIASFSIKEKEDLVEELLANLKMLKELEKEYQEVVKQDNEILKGAVK